MHRHNESVARRNRPGALSRRIAGCILLMLAVTLLHAQSARTLSEVTKVFVAPLGEGPGAKQLHASLVKQFRKNGKFQVVDVPGQADAIVEGEGQLWIKGYMAISPRSSARNRQAVYGGFLSVAVAGKDNEILWSYLVTPSKFLWNSVSDDLSASLVREMVAAHDKKLQVDVAPPGSDSTGDITLHGAGATFPAPLYLKWFESFEQRRPNVHISYDAVGSVEGTRLLLENQLDFAASDVPRSDAATPPSEENFLRIASVLGAVVPIYNLKNMLQDLKFTPEALAGIYLGTIKKWNDPLIRSSNKGVSLPDENIIVVHRLDGSGTTFAWSDYLSKVSANWKTTVGEGTTLRWPVGEEARGNEGVAETVRRTPYSIGYVELVYAIRHRLSFGAVRNAAGEYIRADLSSLGAAAIAGTNGNATSASSITNAPGKGAYPIATFTFFLLPKSLNDERKRAAFIELLQWVLTSGQKECSALGYAPLPREIANQQLETLSRYK